MELFTEAGIFGYIAALLFVVALVFSVRRPDRALARGVVGSSLVLTVGMLGSALGQRLVERAVSQEAVLETKLMMLNIGTRETSSNLLLAGLLSLALIGVSAGVSAARDRQSE